MPDSCSEFPENPIAWSRSAIEAARDRIVARRGPWTAHSIHLGHNVYTREPEKNWRVELFGRIMHDFGFPQLAGVRILDLGCLEGLFAIEYARQGAVSVGIEGREANIEKAMFARDVLGLTDCTFVQDDVAISGCVRWGSSTLCCVLEFCIIWRPRTPSTLFSRYPHVVAGWRSLTRTSRRMSSARPPSP